MSQNVYPCAQNPSHHLSLSDGTDSYGFILTEEDAWQESVLKVNPIRRGLPSGAGSSAPTGKVEVGQYSWIGGRSQEALWENPVGFHDSRNLWTLAEGKLMPGIQWRFAEGLRKASERLPGSVSWQKLCSSTRMVVLDFAPDEDIYLQNIALWLKRIGTPAPLHIELRSDSLPDLSGMAKVTPDWDQDAGLETGDLTEFDTSSDSYGGRLAASSSESYEGDYSLRVTLDGSLSVDPAYVEFTDPAADDLICVEMAFTPNSLSMANLDNFFLLAGLDSGLGVYPFELRMIYSSADGYSLTVKYRTDTASFNISQSKLITDAWHLLRVVWQASSEVGQDDGWINFYVDDQLIDRITGLDTDTFQIDSLRFGCTSGLDSGTSGTFYLDDLRWAHSAGVPAASKHSAINGERGLAILPVSNADQFVRLEPDSAEVSLKIALDLDLTDLDVLVEGSFDLLQLHSSSQMAANLEIEFSAANGFRIDCGETYTTIAAGKRKFLFSFEEGNCVLALDGVVIKSWSGVDGSVTKIDIGIMSIFGEISGCLALDNLRWGLEGDTWREWFNFDEQLPGNLLLDAEIAPDDFQEGLRELYECYFAAGANLFSGTRYHLLLKGSADDNAENVWQAGVDVSSSGAVTGDSDSGWGDAGFDLYRRLTENDMTLRKLHFCEYRGALYAFDQKGDNASSSIYINGARGVVSGAGSTTLTDSSKSWETNQWVGAYIKIIAGTGQGQYRKILLNDADSITVAHWLIEPDAASEYVIYAADTWQEINWSGTPQYPGKIVQVCALNDAVHLARGTSLNALRLRYDPSTGSHVMLEENALMVDGFMVFSDEVNGLKLWNRAGNQISAATPVGWGYTFSFQTSFTLGDENYPIQNLVGFNGELYAIKPDGLFVVRENPVRVGDGEGFLGSENTGAAAAIHNNMLLFNVGGQAIRALRENGDFAEINTWNLNLPENLTGNISDLFSHPHGLFVVINAAGSGISSVLFREDQTESWHEVFRGWVAGKHISHVYWQDCVGTVPRLWINAGGEGLVQNWPSSGVDLQAFSGLEFVDQGLLESGIVDLGAPGAGKWLTGFAASLEKPLGGQGAVNLEYQLDDVIGTDTWQSAGSPAGTRQLEWTSDPEKFYQLRWRLLLETNDCLDPPIVNLVSAKTLIFPEPDYRWTIKTLLPDDGMDLQGNSGPEAGEVINWLQSCFRNGTMLTMRSLWSARDQLSVFLDEVTWQPLMGALGVPQTGGEIRLKLRNV